MTFLGDMGKVATPEQIVLGYRGLRSEAEAVEILEYANPGQYILFRKSDGNNKAGNNKYPIVEMALRVRYGIETYSILFFKISGGNTHNVGAKVYFSGTPLSSMRPGDDGYTQFGVWSSFTDFLTRGGPGRSAREMGSRALKPFYLAAPSWLSTAAANAVRRNSRLNRTRLANRVRTIHQL